MAAPLIEASDVTVSSDATGNTPWSVSRPAQAVGDLIICCLASDATVAHVHNTLPGGPNGETAVVLSQDGAAAGLGGPNSSVWYWIATGANSAGTVTVNPNSVEAWIANVIRVPAGEFDAATPIGAFAENFANSAEVTSAAFAAGADDGDGRLVCWAGADSDDITSTPSGWTPLDDSFVTSLGAQLATRDAATTDSESIASAIWSIAGDTWATFTFIVRGPGGGGPNVNNIDTDNVVYPGQNAVANGTGLAGITSVVYKNPTTLLEVTQTIGTPTATTVPHTVVRGGHAFTKDQDGNSLGGRDPLTAVFTE